MLKTKGFIEPKGSKRDFQGGCMGGWWAEEWVDGVMYGWVCGKTKGFIKTKSLGWMM